MISTSSPRLILISGHQFGASFLRGILNSTEFSKRLLKFPLVLSLHPKHAIQTVGYEDLFPIANKYNLPVKYFHSVKSSEVYNTLIKTPHEYLLVIGLSQLIPSKILEIPCLHNNGIERHSSSYACIGMHPTLLPVGRGRAPIPWSIIKGLQHSGVSAFFLESEADSGSIIGTQKFDIASNETATTLFNKVATAHYKMGKHLAALMATRSLVWQHQIDTDASIWGQRRPEDGWIDFAQPTNQILTLIRATTKPYPGAFFSYQDKIVFVQDAESIFHDTPTKPGVIISVSSDNLPIISTLNGFVKIKAMTCDNALFKFRIGDNISTSMDKVVDNA